MRLLGKRIPSFVNRLARMGSWVKFILPQSLKSLNPIPADGGANTSFSTAASSSQSPRSTYSSSFSGRGVTLSEAQVEIDDMHEEEE